MQVNSPVPKLHMKYIPQAPPFEMIDELLTAADGSAVTQLTIRPDNVLVDGQVFTTAGLIENMAQTAAAGAGFEAHSRGAPPQVGFIGAVKGFVAVSLPVVGDRITTKTTLLNLIGNVQVVKGEVFLEEQCIASAEYKIFLQD